MKHLVPWVLLLSLWSPAVAGEDPPGPPELEGWLPVGKVLETSRDGWIDWTTGKVYAWGRPLPGSQAESSDIEGTRRLAATVEARERMVTILSGLRVDAGSLLSGGEDRQEMIWSLAEGARQVQERVRRGRSLEVRLEVQLHGSTGVGTALLGGTDPGEPPGERAGQRRNRDKGPTGVIVDARGTDLRPAYLPRILAPSGDVLWSVDQADPSTRVSRGLAAYGRVSRVPGAEPSELEWRIHPVLSRMGRRPAVLRAREAAGTLLADAVLDEDSAKELAESEALRRLLAGARLIFVID